MSDGNTSPNHKRKARLVTYGKQTKRAFDKWREFGKGDDVVKATTSEAKPSPEPEPPALPNRPAPSPVPEVTMTVEPSEENVMLLCAFCEGLDVDTARRFLKVKNNDVQSAVNAVMDGEDINKLETAGTWDERMFSSGRDNDAGLQPLGASAGPTRGPSPAPSLAVKKPTTHAEEQDDLDAALAASRAESGMPYQEMGIKTAEGKEVQFGPENKYHDASQWAMVPYSSAGGHSASEIIPDVDVLDRANVAGEPRLLKHLPDGDYAPNLLTILHSIPAAREALLARHDVREDYGEDAEWWRGHAIPLPRIVHVDDGVAADPGTDKREGFIAEVQRLMAFLDASDRSYATVGALQETDLIKSATNSYSLMQTFLEGWIAAASAEPSPATTDPQQLFTTIGRSTSEAENVDTPHLNVIEMSVAAPGSVQLTDMLDDLIWGTDTDSAYPDNYIERPADILIMQVSHSRYSATQLGVEVPATLKLDKYLKENITAASAIRQQVLDTKKVVAAYEEKVDRLKHIVNPKKPSEKLDARAVLEHTLGHYTGANRKDEESEDVTEFALPPHYADIAAGLKTAMEKLDAQMKRFAEEKEKYQSAMMAQLKAPLHGIEEQDRYRYTLRGVVTKPNITYILRPKHVPSETEDEDMISFEDAKDAPSVEPIDADDTTPPGMQWWRLEYEITGATARTSKTKTPDYDVLRAVELEHRTALLVYANSSATDPAIPASTTLPSPLQTFLTRDNALFANDLRTERIRPPRYESYQTNHNHPDDPFADNPTENDTIHASIEDYDDRAFRAAAFSSRRRNDSSDSTRVQDGDSPPPGYSRGSDADWDVGLEKHASFGLGYGSGIEEVGGGFEDGRGGKEMVQVASVGGLGGLRGRGRGREEVEVEERVVDIVLDEEEDVSGGKSGEVAGDVPMAGAESQHYGVAK